MHAKRVAKGLLCAFATSLVFQNVAAVEGGADGVMPNARGVLDENGGPPGPGLLWQKKPLNPALVPGVMHPDYLPLATGASLAAYEYGNTHSNNLFFFIGGLFDGLFTLPYSSYLGYNLTNWASVQCLLTSSYSYWGFSSLHRDATEMSACISYMANYKKQQTGKIGKIVLMGSSTGANDIMWYLSRGHQGERHPIDGAILQGPVSDQDYIHYAQPQDGSLREGQKIANGFLNSGNATEPMPNVYERDIYASPLNAYRFWSLSTYGGDDDFFSANTSDAVRATTFGKVDVPLLILWSGADQYVPPYVNGAKLVNEFIAAQQPSTRSQYSGIIPNATHSVGKNPGRNDLIKRVIGFLDKDIGVPAKVPTTDVNAAS